MALRRAFPAERRLREGGRAPSRPRPPASLARIEHEAALAVASSFELHYRFAPRLRSIAASLLVSRRRISLAAQPAAARSRPRRLRPGSWFARTDPRRRTGSLAASRRTSSSALSTRWRPCSRGARSGTRAVRTGARRGREGGRRKARSARGRAPWIPRATATSCSRTTPGWRRRSQRARLPAP